MSIKKNWLLLNKRRYALSCIIYHVITFWWSKWIIMINKLFWIKFCGLHLCCILWMFWLWPTIIAFSNALCRNLQSQWWCVFNCIELQVNFQAELGLQLHNFLFHSPWSCKFSCEMLKRTFKAYNPMESYATTESMFIMQFVYFGKITSIQQMYFP